MSDDSEKYSVYKALSVLLLLCLVGVVALYGWYSDKLAANIASRDSDVTVANERLAAADAQIGLLSQTETGLRADIEAMTSAHRTEVARLQGDLEAARRANAGLEQDIAAMRQQHAAALAATEAELQAQVERFQALEQSMADAVMAHEASVASLGEQHAAELDALEQTANERVAFFRTALEGTEPERAQQLIAIEEALIATRGQFAEAEQRIETLEGIERELGAQNAATEAALAETQERLASRDQELNAATAAIAQTRQELLETQQASAAARQAAAVELAALEQRLQLTIDEGRAAQAAADALLQQTRDEAAAALDAARQEAAAALDSARQAAAAAMAEAQAGFDNEIQAAGSRIAEFEAQLAQTETDLARLQETFDNVKRDLEARLVQGEKDLADVRAELAATVAARDTLDRELASARDDIARLEQTMADERQQAEQALQASEAAGREAVARVRDMYQAFGRLGARQTEDGMLLNLGGRELNFRIGQATLRDEEAPSLDNLATIMISNPELTARIEGHTDSSGRDETNMALSQARAETVLAALVERGVAAERLAAEGFGETRPIGDNETSFGRFQNRRVDIYVQGH